MSDLAVCRRHMVTHLMRHLFQDSCRAMYGAGQRSHRRTISPRWFSVSYRALFGAGSFHAVRTSSRNRTSNCIIRSNRRGSAFISFYLTGVRTAGCESTESGLCRARFRSLREVSASADWRRIKLFDASGIRIELWGHCSGLWPFSKRGGLHYHNGRNIYHINLLLSPIN